MTVPETQTQTPVMTAATLYDALLHNTAPYILDVRNPDDFARWLIEGRAGLTVENIPYYNFIEDEDGAVARVPADREVLVVCAKEGASQYVADLLRARGVNASYLEGGILSWGISTIRAILLSLPGVESFRWRARHAAMSVSSSSATALRR